jgi:hypothetical protein
MNAGHLPAFKGEQLCGQSYDCVTNTLGRLMGSTVSPLFVYIVVNCQTYAKDLGHTALQKHSEMYLLS